jgi:L,D-transpeptidase YcbB
MKATITIALLISVLAIACQDDPNKPSEKQRKQKQSERNTSINPANAYNDLFVDSMQVEQFIAQQKVSDTVSESMRLFYNHRNFQFAWFDSRGLSEQALAFRNLYDYSDTTDAKKVLDRRLDRLMTEEQLQPRATDASIVKTELMLTWRFINYVWDTYSNRGTRELALKELIPAKKEDILAKANIELKDSDHDRIVKNSWYAPLKKELKKYTAIAEEGGWENIPVPSRKIRPGKKDTVIVLLKKRLQRTDEFSTKDSSAVYTPELEKVIRKIQSRHGYKPDGIITSSLVKELNVPVTSRIKQLLVNLERMRWMPEADRGRMILVNIPEFTLYVREGEDSVFTMPIVVGKQGHNTVMFSGKLNQVVFSPYWNLPQSIVEKEVLPEMDKNSDYLAEKNMEITGEEDGLPVIRQLPGEKNELGRVKFLFPNSFNIYFHDTPHKELFKQTKRAYSHGCIRLSEPVKLAKYLLADQPEWTDEKIDSALVADKEKFVRIKDPVPVMIYYYTAWVDGSGNLQWREDTYGRDSQMANKLFMNGNARAMQTLASNNQKK